MSKEFYPRIRVSRVFRLLAALFLGANIASCAREQNVDPTSIPEPVEPTVENTTVFPATEIPENPIPGTTPTITPTEVPSSIENQNERESVRAKLAQEAYRMSFLLDSYIVEAQSEEIANITQHYLRINNQEIIYFQTGERGLSLTVKDESGQIIEEVMVVENSILMIDPTTGELVIADPGAYFIEQGDYAGKLTQITPEGWVVYIPGEGWTNLENQHEEVEPTAPTPAVNIIPFAGGMGEMPSDLSEEEIAQMTEIFEEIDQASTDQISFLEGHEELAGAELQQHLAGPYEKFGTENREFAFQIFYEVINPPQNNNSSNNPLEVGSIVWVNEQGLHIIEPGVDVRAAVDGVFQGNFIREFRDENEVRGFEVYDSQTGEMLRSETLMGIEVSLDFSVYLNNPNLSEDIKDVLRSIEYRSIEGDWLLEQTILTTFAGPAFEGRYGETPEEVRAYLEENDYVLEGVRFPRSPQDNRYRIVVPPEEHTVDLKQGFKIIWHNSFQDGMVVASESDGSIIRAGAMFSVNNEGQLTLDYYLKEFDLEIYSRYFEEKDIPSMIVAGLTQNISIALHFLGNCPKDIGGTEELYNSGVFLHWIIANKLGANINGLHQIRINFEREYGHEWWKILELMLVQSEFDLVEKSAVWQFGN